MRPGCAARIPLRSEDEWYMSPVDLIYPIEENAVEMAPAELRDWLSLRRDSIDIWRASYEEFGQEFSREQACDEFPMVWL